MKVKQIFFKNKLRNFSYLIEFKSGVVICIDPFHHDLVLGALNEKKIHIIINTHDHCDHHSGNEILINKFNPVVAAHELANVPGKSRNLKHQEVVYVEDEFAIIALDTPGHTMSHISLLLKRAGRNYGIFSGDTFFNAGVGNCFNGGDVHRLFDSIENYYEHLEDEVLVYPGHDYLRRNLEFTLSLDKNNQKAILLLNKLEKISDEDTLLINNMATEREINNFLRLECESIKNNFENKSRRDVFVQLRALRDKW